MTRTVLLLLSICITTVALADPEDSRRPGGVAIVDVGTSKMAAPEVSLGDKPVLVMQDGDRWKAVAGIPLDTDPGNVSLTVNGIKVPVTIKKHGYTEQRITVKNQSYVTPDQAQLDRVGCFAYSPVEGARANDLPGAVDDAVRAHHRPRPYLYVFADDAEGLHLDRLVEFSLGVHYRARMYAHAV